MPISASSIHASLSAERVYNIVTVLPCVPPSRTDCDVPRGCIDQQRLSGRSVSGTLMLLLVRDTVLASRSPETRTQREFFRHGRGVRRARCRHPVAPGHAGPRHFQRGSRWCCAGLTNRPAVRARRVGANAGASNSGTGSTRLGGAEKTTDVTAVGGDVGRAESAQDATDARTTMAAGPPCSEIE
jgi:hypothetical protein